LLLLISYDLATAGRPSRREAVEAVIKEASTDQRNPSHCVWLVDTTENVEAFGQRLTPLMTSEDRLIIVRVQSPAAINGWLPRANWEWINEHGS
jgi:hypothetical protein